MLFKIVLWNPTRNRVEERANCSFFCKILIVNFPRIFRKIPIKPIILWKNQRFEYGCLLVDLLSVSFFDGKTIGIINTRKKTVFQLKICISTNVGEKRSTYYKKKTTLCGSISKSINQFRNFILRTLKAFNPFVCTLEEKLVLTSIMLSSGLICFNLALTLWQKDLLISIVLLKL